MKTHVVLSTPNLPKVVASSSRTDANSELRNVECDRIVFPLELRQQSLNSIGLRQSQLPTVCQNALRGLGVIKRRIGIRNRDYVAEHLVAQYQCNSERIWRKLLATEYEHALQIILEARVRYDGAYSGWLSLQDSFNDIIVRQFVIFLGQHGLPGTQRVVASNGNLISPHSPFDQNYSVDADHLRRIHKRQNQLPGSHPYDERGGAQNRFLKKREQKGLKPRQLAVLNSLIGVAAANGLLN